jgi:hypothetical protein
MRIKAIKNWLERRRGIFTPGFSCLVNIFSLKNLDIKFLNIVVSDESASL